MIVFTSASDRKNDDPPIVHIPNLGTVMGYYKMSEKGRKYAAFEGIPYVQQPQNILRFQVLNKCNHYLAKMSF